MSVLLPIIAYPVYYNVRCNQEMEYSPEFAIRLIESAESLFEKSHDKEETVRAVLYLSCVSCEISLKALLERVGYTPKELKGLSHRLDKLLNEVSSCVHSETGLRSSSIRAKVVVPGTANGTVGTMLTSDISGASVYPNEIRYGEVVKHYPPVAILNCAKVVSEWCAENGENLRRA